MYVCVYIYMCVYLCRWRGRVLQLTSVVQGRTQHTCSILCFRKGYSLYFTFGPGQMTEVLFLISDSVGYYF